MKLSKSMSKRILDSSIHRSMRNFFQLHALFVYSIDLVFCEMVYAFKKKKQNNKPHSMKSINCYSHEWMHDEQIANESAKRCTALCATPHHTTSHHTSDILLLEWHINGCQMQRKVVIDVRSPIHYLCGMY